MKKKLLLLGILFFNCIFIFANDTSCIKKNVVVKHIDSFDYFFIIKVIEVNKDIELTIFSLKKDSISSKYKNVKVGDSIYTCLFSRTTLEIAPNYLISYHPQTNWLYQNKVILEKGKAIFISNNFNNLQYINRGCN